MTRNLHDPDREHDWILAFTRGDQAEADRLRRALRVIRDHEQDQGVVDRVDAVLSGRSTLRELLRDPGFAHPVENTVRHHVRAWYEHSPEEQRLLADRGRADLEDRDEGPGDPGANAGA